MTTCHIVAAAAHVTTPRRTESIMQNPDTRHFARLLQGYFRFYGDIIAAQQEASKMYTTTFLLSTPPIRSHYILLCLRPPLPYSPRCVCNVSGVAGPINLSPPDCHLGYLVISTVHSDILAIYSGDWIFELQYSHSHSCYIFVVLFSIKKKHTHKKQINMGVNG